MITNDNNNCTSNSLCVFSIRVFMVLEEEGDNIWCTDWSIH